MIPRKHKFVDNLLEQNDRLELLLLALAHALGEHSNLFKVLPQMLDEFELLLSFFRGLMSRTGSSGPGLGKT